MTFYRGKYDSTDQTHKIGPKLKVISHQIKSIIQRNKQGAAVAFSGKISSTEAITKGSVVIAEENGIRTPYTVGPISVGMGGIYIYLLEEDGMI
jgi:hypothetical protein